MNLLEKLKELETEVDAILKIAHRKRREIDGAINWADLGVVDTRFWQNTDGDVGYQIWIEEAEPESTELIEFIQERITVVDPVTVEIITEW